MHFMLEGCAVWEMQYSNEMYIFIDGKMAQLDRPHFGMDIK